MGDTGEQDPDYATETVYPPPGFEDQSFRELEFARLPPEDMLARGRQFADLLARRRSVRAFSPEPVPRQLIELAVRAASTAPSGAHQQPWKFALVGDSVLKHRIRLAAEEEERKGYEGGRMPDDWKNVLRPLATTADKSYLDVAPWIVVVFEERYGLGPDGIRTKHYYVAESVGIACGLFIAALHAMGLATLTHTPSPMGFLCDILGRPKNEAPFIVFPVGYPAPGAMVPDLRRKRLDEILLDY